MHSELAGGLFCWDKQLAAHRGDEAAALEGFSAWLWSGNGFSRERYAKLGLERPQVPEEVIQMQERRAKERAHVTAQSEGLATAAGHGLESLRAKEGMAQPHAPGAITNPRFYDTSRNNAAQVTR